MSAVQLNLFFLLQVMLTVPKHTSEAATTNNCTSSVHPADSCDKITYEQVYNVLAKSENSFNIESALYPAKKPSSVRVFVQVYGPNKTENSTPAAKYTWSISCLYAALPARVLEFWSLWSIMVTTRTQKLNVTISLFCCDVTKGKLKKHIEDALAALEDLAVSPSIRDPRLNSAECITEGHEPDIIGTGHSWRIITVLVCSFLFSVLSGPLLAFFAMQYRESQPKIKQKTIDFLCGFLLFTFIALFIIKEGIVHGHDKVNVPWYIEVIHPIPVIISVGVVVFLCTFRSCGAESSGTDGVKIEAIVYIICANLTAYHFCWLIVGIMLNPIWGLAALLIVCLVIGVYTYAVYNFFCSTDTSPRNRPQGSVNENGNSSGQNVAAGSTSTGNTDDTSSNNNCDSYCAQSFFSCLAGFLAVCCLIVVVILTAQSYNGRETADEVLKDAVLYFISVSFSWLYWKNHAPKSITSATTQTGQSCDPTTEETSV